MQSGPYLSGLPFIAENKPKGEFFLDEGALQQVLRRKKPCRIFWEDMSDMFLEDYPDEWIDRCFAVMALTPHLTHQVLTKRATRLVNYMCTSDCSLRKAEIAAAAKALSAQRSPYTLPSENVFEARSVALGEPWKIHAWPFPNVHLGVSVEDQQRADERIPLLLQTPAVVRFLSVEPLLGPVDLDSEFAEGAHALGCGDRGCDTCSELPDNGRGVDWVIVGGESGPGARPCDTEWIRSIVQQCKAAGVPVFVKQLGAYVIQGGGHRIKKDKKGGDPSEWEHDLRVRETPAAGDKGRL